MAFSFISKYILLHDFLSIHDVYAATEQLKVVAYIATVNAVDAQVYRFLGVFVQQY